MTHLRPRSDLRFSFVRHHIRLLLLGLVAIAAAFGTAGQASAAPPCWKQLIQDWYDGRIDGTYPIPCYQQAIDHLPTDADQYSSAADDIRRALQKRIADRNRGTTTPTTTGGGNQGGPTAPSSGGNGGPGKPSGTPGRKPGGGPVGDTLKNIGPKNADSIPIPLIVLGSIAVLLLLAGSAGFVLRRLQARRVPIRPSSSASQQ